MIERAHLEGQECNRMETLECPANTLTKMQRW